VGVLGQIFDGCIKAYSIFTTANNLGKDSERLVCKLRIEEMRLMVWGREWGVQEGKLEAHIVASGSSDGLRQMAEMILKQLLDTITDFHKLQDRYGLRAQEKNGVPDSKNQDQTLKGRKSPEIDKPKGRLDELRLRARWVIQDKEKFQLLLSDLKDFNDGLERLFPGRSQATLTRAWQNELLSTLKDVAQLDLVESASSGVYPQLNNSASLKSLRINLDLAESKSNYIPTSALKLSLSSLDLSNPIDTSLNRQTGLHTRSSGDSPRQILIEWLSYDSDLDLESRLHLYQRVDNLSRLVRAATSRHPDLHTLDALGYLDDTASSRYGLVYALPTTISIVPSKIPTTLSSMIESANTRTPDLGSRFSLAHTLAIAIWSFHSLDWLHKTICPTNILFFDSDTPESKSTSTPSLRSPYLTGFTSSRPSLAHSQTAPSRGLASSDLYRHPNSLGVFRQPYDKTFDIYSLGLVLLEIGLWKSLSAFHKPKYTPVTFREKVVDAVLVPGLGSKTGLVYQKIVETCLNAGGNEGKEGKQAEDGTLLERVVNMLEQLKV
jgi:hypothetical protein